METGISCVMPTTRDRTWCIPLAIEWWRRQTYGENTELILVSEHREVEWFCDDARIRFVPVPKTISLGDKFSAGTLSARYPWVALWADDDWYAPRRLAESYRVAEFYDVDMVGTEALLFHELTPGRRSFRYEWPGVNWVAGTTLMFRQHVLSRVTFQDRASGVDTLFVADAFAAGVRCARFGDIGLAVAMVHGQSTGRKEWRPEPPEYVPWPGSMREVMCEDLDMYEEAFANRL